MNKHLINGFIDELEKISQKPTIKQKLYPVRGVGIASGIGAIGGSLLGIKSGIQEASEAGVLQAAKKGDIAAKRGVRWYIKREAFRKAKAGAILLGLGALAGTLAESLIKNSFIDLYRKPAIGKRITRKTMKRPVIGKRITSRTLRAK